MSLLEDTMAKIAIFNRKIAEKGFKKEDAKALIIATESVQAVKKFGNKFESYSFMITLLDRYDDAVKLLHDFCKIIVPRNA